MKQVRITYEYSGLNIHEDITAYIILPMQDDYADDIIMAIRNGKSPPNAIENALKALSWMLGGSFNRIISAEIAMPKPLWHVTWYDHEGNQQEREFEFAIDAFEEAEYLEQKYVGVTIAVKRDKP